MFEHVARDLQGIGKCTGIDRPDHKGGHYFILGAVAASQDTLDVGLVSRQQLNLERGLALIALNVFQAQAVLQQLGQLKFVGRGTSHARQGGCGGGLQLRENAEPVALSE
ncbi:hypothetical protein D3C86_1587240 [compost metagenome]